MTSEAEFRTLAERQFDVEDARGRSYRVTRYVWQERQGDGWTDLFDLLLTTQGGHLDPLPDGTYCVDGTGTHVRVVEGSVRTHESRRMDPVLPAGATGTH